MMDTAAQLGAVVAGFIDGKVAAVQTVADERAAALADANARLSATAAALAEAQANDAVDQATIASLRAALAAATRSPHYLDGWGEPVFLDEFGGDQLDPSKWRVYDDYQLSYDQATVMARNVQVRNGQLHMLAKRETVRGRAWTSSYITTGPLATDRSKPALFSQKYGRFEVRAKIPTTALNSAGHWVAPLWMRGINVTGEIDVFEAWGEPTNGPTSQQYRAGSGQNTLHQDTNHAPGTTKRTQWETPAGAPRLSDDFHTYGVEWTPGGFRFLLDGKPIQYATYTNAQLGFPTSVFDDLFHLRVQMQVGQPSYWGVPDANTKDADMVVDWVRAYAYKE